MGRRKSFKVETALDAIVLAFAGRGYNATSMRDLAAATGLELGSLYNAFGDKESIFGHALDRHFTTFWEPLLADGGTPARTLKTHYTRLTKQLLAGQVVPGSLLAIGLIEWPTHEESNRDRIRGFLARVFEFYRRHLLQMGDEGRKTGLSGRRLKRATTTQAAQEMLGTTLSMIVLARMGNQGPAIRAMAAAALRHVG